MNASLGDPAGVEIDSSTLRWVGVYPACFLTFTPQGSSTPATLLPQVELAIAAIDADVADGLVNVTAIVEGTDALHIRVHYKDAQRRQVRQWATHLAGALTAAGLSGTLSRLPPQYAPAWASSDSVENRAISVLYAARTSIDSDFTRRLSSAHGVHLFPHHVLSSGSKFSFAVPYSPELVSVMADLQSLAVLKGTDHTPPNQARIQTSQFSASGWTHLGDRTEQVARARGALVELAPDLDQAFAEVTTGLGRWAATSHHPPHGLTAEALIQQRGLLPHRVIDAHGLQVLTDHHLERASSLTDWHTRQIGDRYLVEARDLEPWFMDDEPDPEVLAKARADFGEMIMTRPEFDAMLAAEHAAQVREYQARLAGGEAT